MNGTPRDDTTSAILDDEDRRYVESLAPGAERDAVVASVLRYRAPEALAAGDPLPAVTLRRVADLAPTSRRPSRNGADRHARPPRASA